MFLSFGQGKHFRFEELATSEFSKVDFSMVPLPLLPASLLGIRLLARSELVQGGIRNLKKLWVSLLISPLYQSIIFCCCCNMFVGSLKTCFEFLPLRCYLQKVGWGDLLCSPCPCQTVWCWCCSYTALQPPGWCCQEPSLRGLRSFWMFSTEMKIPVLIYCAVNKLFCNSRFVFGSGLPLPGLFWYSAVFVLL